MLKGLNSSNDTLDGGYFPSRVFASIIIGLAGLVLYADKLFNQIGYQFSIPEKFSEAGMTFETFVWLWAQTLSPLMLIVGAMLKPYKYVYLIPLFCYLLQVYTLAFDSQDFTYQGLYAIGTTLLIFFAIEMIKKYFRRSLQEEINSMREEVLENITDVHK